MKNLFLSVLVGAALFSCSKTEIQQTTDQIKRADSLFRTANEGIKTLDSISKTINDSNGIARKVIIPEIEKQKKMIDSTIKSGNYKIDSINKDLEKITKHVKTGTEVAKTLDSANQALKNGENAISVLTKTADKILKQTKPKTSTVPPSSAPNSSATEQNQAQTTPPQNTVVVPPVIEKNPLVKTARLEINVKNLSNAKALLQQHIRDTNGDLVTENYSSNEGVQKEYITAKVPLKNFEQLVSSASGDLGEVKMKNTESEGTDYLPNQMCDVEITLVQNELTESSKADESVTADDNKDSYGNAFMKGFKVLGDGLLFLLPFWPVFLIGGLAWYFISRNKKKRQREEFERQMQLHQQQQTNAQYPTQNQTSTDQISTEKNEDDGEPDYSKYLPKE